MKRKHEENTLFEGQQAQFSRSALNQRFILPPFSVLSARDGGWQRRKNMWLSLGIKSETGRSDKLLGGFKSLQQVTLKNELSDNKLVAEVSIFDPVLCELLYTWFCPPNGKILDPFAGGAVRGIVSSILGFRYSGCDLRQEQIDANKLQGEALLDIDDPSPTWVVGDSQDIQQHLPGEYDYLFSCPPYGDLEVYSDDEADISNMGQEEFLKAYKIIIKNASAMLKVDSFACFVVGDYRDKYGNLANFPALTTEAFLEAGLIFYNEAVLVTAAGSLPIRVSRGFPVGRKLGKTHQNILVYVKGDARRASAKITGAEMPVLKVRSIAQRPQQAMPVATWQPPADFPNLDGCKQIAIDVETCDPDLEKLGPGVRRGAYIVGLSVGTDYGYRGYFPIRHQGGGNMNAVSVLGWAKEVLNKFDGTVVGHNIIYDLDFLANEQIVFPNVTRFLDTMIAEPLLDEHRFKYSLDALSQDYLQVSKNELLLRQTCQAAGFGQDDKSIKSNLWKLPGNHVGPYGEGDVDLPLRILPLQIEALAKLNMIDLFRLECDLTPMLLAMRRRGVRVNIGRAEQVRAELVMRRDAALAEFRRLLGTPRAELMAPASFAPALAERGLPMARTPQGKSYSITKGWLEANKNDPAVAQLLIGRGLDKTIGTFLDSAILGHHTNGRIHTQFHQLKGERGGTIGRFSSSSPNLQQIPARDEELSPLIRGIFEPEEGEEWERLDYSQIEVRFEAHYAVGMRADEFRQKYIDDPKTDYHKFTAELLNADPEDKVLRKRIKGTNFAKKYGAMAPKLATTFGCSLAEAEEFVRKYEAAMPWTKATFDKCQNVAAARGYIKTILGRYARFPLWEPASNARRKRDERVVALPREKAEEAYKGQFLVRANTYTAMNRLFQLGSADMLKKSMVDIWKSGVCNVLGAPLLTVHDELDLGVPANGNEAAREVRHLMETAIKLRVPVIVETTRGKNWGEAS